MKKKTPAAQSQDPFSKAQGVNENRKYDQLYNLRKKQIDKTDKSKVDYEFERQQEECTFAPQLYTNKTYGQNASAPRRNTPGLVSSSVTSMPSVQQQSMSTRDRQERTEQKNLERMRKAREEKERKAEMFERGIPKPKPLTAAQLEQ